MKRKHIDITGFNINAGAWIHTRPAKNFTFTQVNGVNFAVTENNYYLCTKSDKVRCKTMKVGQASYKHLYHVYMEVYPGIFADLPRTATENSLTEVLEYFSKIYHDQDYANKPDVETWRKQLQRKN